MFTCFFEKKTFNNFLFFLFFSFCIQSQENNQKLHFSPKVTHYSRLDFNANEQFYSLIEGENGILYFGNNDGVLIFDGERWQTISLPNNSAATSLVNNEKGEVYVGGYNELGQIVKDSLGGYSFRSLREQFKLDATNFEYLWQAHSLGKTVIFRSFNELLMVRNKILTHLKPENVFSFSGVINNELYVMDYGKGFKKYDKGQKKLVHVLEDIPIAFSDISGLLEINGSKDFLVVTSSGKIFKVNSASRTASLWKEVLTDNSQEIVTAVNFKGGYLLGTNESGLIYLSETGATEANNPAFSKMGNTSLVRLVTMDDRIWFLTKSGLSLLEFNLPDFHLFNGVSVYDILLDESMIYLATNSGVYYSEFETTESIISGLSFIKLPDLDGQVWNIDKFEKDILISGHNGLYRLENNVPQPLNDLDPFWKVLPVEGKPNTYLAAGYHGLYLLVHNDDSWIFKSKIKGFDESSRDILQADELNTFWICHGYKGVYRLTLDDELTRTISIEHFTDQNGFESPYNINVVRYNNDIVFTSNTGVYSYEEREKRFVPYTYLNDILDPGFNTTKILKSGSRTWLVQNDEFGYFDSGNKEVDLHKDLFLNLNGKLNRSMESFVPLEDKSVLIGANDGLYLYRTKMNHAETDRNTLISNVQYYDGESNLWTKIPLSDQLQLPGQVDVMRFEFTNPQMSSSVRKQYQFKLENIDSNWSEWSDIPFKEYTYLEPGNHDFKVRSRNMIGQKGNEASFSFVIAHAWYETEMAMFLMLLLVILVIYLIVFWVRRFVRRKIQKEKDIVENSKRVLELEIEQLKLKQQTQQIELQKNKLEEDLINHQKELANYTMLLVKKKDIIYSIYDDLKSVSNNFKQATQRRSIDTILNKIRQHRIGEEYMDVFDVNFEKVHVDFFKRLLDINPDLTKRELRLCAFVKMDLSNKEIAPLLNISVRGVETGRYRVRKKLGIQEKNFKAYLENSLNDQKDVV
ncbi:triple tyrosine motif-containing protein [Lutimonas sp.]|uniref:helix-turn-helix and ligand-binding sensor domain-containing protein n=1 Tax=Lutimonas sp. TaxID=1872403 RepID=UPI003D9BA51E